DRKARSEFEAPAPCRVRFFDFAKLTQACCKVSIASVIPDRHASPKSHERSLVITRQILGVAQELLEPLRIDGIEAHNPFRHLARFYCFALPQQDIDSRLRRHRVVWVLG